MASGLSSSRVEELLLTPRTRICYLQENPKKQQSAARERYEQYKSARSVEEARELGAALGDLRYDYHHGWLTFVLQRPRSPSAHRHRREPSRAPTRREPSVAKTTRREPSVVKTTRREPPVAKFVQLLPRDRHRDRDREPYAYVFSLGTRCLVKDSLDQLKLTRFGGPFDWIYTNVKMVRDCLQDNFDSFLDERCFYTSGKKVGHRKYSEMLNRGIIFIHHDPRTPEGRARDLRKVQRFRKVLQKPVRKLFVMAELISSEKAHSRAELTFGLRGRERDSDVANLFRTIRGKCAGSFELLVVLMMLQGASHNGRCKSKGVSEARDVPHVRRRVVDYENGPCSLVVHELHCVGECTGLRLTEEADVKMLQELLRGRRTFSLQEDPLKQADRDNERKRPRSATPVREPLYKRREPAPLRRSVAPSRGPASGSASSGHRVRHRQHA